MKPIKIDKIDRDARNYGAKSWIVFCYAVLDENYKKFFRTIITLNKIEFGAKLISTQDYRRFMKPRSPSWLVVDLPRERVLQLTRDLEAL